MQEVIAPLVFNKRSSSRRPVHAALRIPRSRFMLLHTLRNRKAAGAAVKTPAHLQHIAQNLTREIAKTLRLAIGTR
ncbi:MAG: hypothetical protein WD894_14825 [Pirellulales bacterium]